MKSTILALMRNRLTSSLPDMSEAKKTAAAVEADQIIRQSQEEFAAANSKPLEAYKIGVPNFTEGHRLKIADRHHGTEGE